MKNKTLPQEDVNKIFNEIDMINKSVNFLGRKIEETEDPESITRLLRKVEIESEMLNKLEKKYEEYIKQNKN